MSNIQHQLCGVIPEHMLNRIASRSGPETSKIALATLEQMHEIAAGRALRTDSSEVEQAVAPARKIRRIYDAKHQHQAPGHLVLEEGGERPADVAVNESYDNSGATYDYYEQVHGWSSVDGKGKRLDSTVHYGRNFNNAMWDGTQMIYGDGDGKIFQRLTRPSEVTGHEFTHGVTQHTAKLIYSGQAGALNEHVSDAFGSMIRQRLRNEMSAQASWVIGEGVLAPGIQGIGIRSMADPGNAYNDPILGKDPQPAHMRFYVETASDNGGVHINSGIPNHAFYLAAKGLGGFAWEVLGRVWWKTLKERLTPTVDFKGFARATVEVAGEMCGIGGHVQKTIAQAWALVGIAVPLRIAAAISSLKRHQSNWGRRTF
jgi:Zn-dependent metalloprotease